MNRGKEKTTSVMNVPYTGGVLVKEVYERIKLSRQIDGVKTKIQEGEGDVLSTECNIIIIAVKIIQLLCSFLDYIFLDYNVTTDISPS